MRCIHNEDFHSHVGLQNVRVYTSNYMWQSLCLPLTISSTGQNNSHILQNLKVHYFVCKTLPLVFLLTQLSPLTLGNFTYVMKCSPATLYHIQTTQMWMILFTAWMWQRLTGQNVIICRQIQSTSLHSYSLRTLLILSSLYVQFPTLLPTKILCGFLSSNIHAKHSASLHHPNNICYEQKIYNFHSPSFPSS